MRLTQKEIEVIKAVVAEKLDPNAEVKLFGSRLDDKRRGGDIDLFVKTNQVIESPAKIIAQIQAALIMRLGDQKYDVLLMAPNLKEYEIHQIANQNGVVL